MIFSFSNSKFVKDTIKSFCLQDFKTSDSYFADISDCIILNASVAIAITKFDGIVKPPLIKISLLK